MPPVGCADGRSAPRAGAARGARTHNVPGSPGPGTTHAPTAAGAATSSACARAGERCAAHPAPAMARTPSWTDPLGPLAPSPARTYPEVVVWAATKRFTMNSTPVSVMWRRSPPKRLARVAISYDGQ